MALRRFWVEKSLALGASVPIDGDLFHHIRDVCRFERGDRFELLPGDQKAYLVKILDLGKRSLEVEVLEAREIPELSRPFLHLCLSIPKFATFEAVIEKSVELGVKSVRPFFSDYSFVKDVKRLDGAKWKRWEKILLSATQQCGRGEKMDLQNPVPLPQLLKSINPSQGQVGLFSYEGEVAQGARSALEQLQSQKPQEIYIFVGAEGGFSRQEADLFRQVGLLPTGLGEQILRVETACVTLISIIKYQMNLMG